MKSLHEIVATGNVAEVKKFIKVKNKKALHELVNGKNALCATLALENCIPMMEVLLKAGLDINEGTGITKEGEIIRSNVLHLTICTYYGDSELVDFILKQKNISIYPDQLALAALKANECAFKKLLNHEKVDSELVKMAFGLFIEDAQKFLTEHTRNYYIKLFLTHSKLQDFDVEASPLQNIHDLKIIVKPSLYPSLNEIERTAFKARVPTLFSQGWITEEEWIILSILNNDVDLFAAAFDAGIHPFNVGYNLKSPFLTTIILKNIDCLLYLVGRPDFKPNYWQKKSSSQSYQEIWEQKKVTCEVDLKFPQTITQSPIHQILLWILQLRKDLTLTRLIYKKNTMDDINETIMIDEVLRMTQKYRIESSHKALVETIQSHKVEIAQVMHTRPVWKGFDNIYQNLLSESSLIPDETTQPLEYSSLNFQIDLLNKVAKELSLEDDNVNFLMELVTLNSVLLCWHQEVSNRPQALPFKLAIDMIQYTTRLIQNSTKNNTILLGGALQYQLLHCVNQCCVIELYTSLDRKEQKRYLTSLLTLFSFFWNTYGKDYWNCRFDNLDYAFGDLTLQGNDELYYLEPLKAFIGNIEALTKREYLLEQDKLCHFDLANPLETLQQFVPLLKSMIGAQEIPMFSPLNEILQSFDDLEEKFQTAHLERQQQSTIFSEILLSLETKEKEKQRIHAEKVQRSVHQRQQLKTRFIAKHQDEARKEDLSYTTEQIIDKKIAKLFKLDSIETHDEIKNKLYQLHDEDTSSFYQRISVISALLDLRTLQSSQLIANITDLHHRINQIDFCKASYLRDQNTLKQIAQMVKKNGERKAKYEEMHLLLCESSEELGHLKNLLTKQSWIGIDDSLISFLHQYLQSSIEILAKTVEYFQKLPSQIKAWMIKRKEYLDTLPKRENFEQNKDNEAYIVWDFVRQSKKIERLNKKIESLSRLYSEVLTKVASYRPAPDINSLNEFPNLNEVIQSPVLEEKELLDPMLEHLQHKAISTLQTFNKEGFIHSYLVGSAAHAIAKGAQRLITPRDLDYRIFIPTHSLNDAGLLLQQLNFVPNPFIPNLWRHKEDFQTEVTLQVVSDLSVCTGKLSDSILIEDASRKSETWMSYFISLEEDNQLKVITPLKQANQHCEQALIESPHDALERAMKDPAVLLRWLDIKNRSGGTLSENIIFALRHCSVLLTEKQYNHLCALAKKHLRPQDDFDNSLQYVALLQSPKMGNLLYKIWGIQAASAKEGKEKLMQCLYAGMKPAHQIQHPQYFTPQIDTRLYDRYSVWQSNKLKEEGISLQVQALLL